MTDRWYRYRDPLEVLIREEEQESGCRACVFCRHSPKLGRWECEAKQADCPDRDRRNCHLWTARRKQC